MKYPIEITDREELLCYLPKNGIVAELGVCAGMYSEAIRAACTPKTLYLVDMWENAKEPYPNVRLAKSYRRLVEVTFNWREDVKIVWEDDLVFLSGSENNYFDWVYLDSDHSYEHVYKLLEISAKKVKDNGYICGHDYAEGIKLEVIPAVDDFIKSTNWRMKYITIADVYFSYVLCKEEYL